MAKIADIIGYICENYPHKDELSKARLTKMVYLSDWKSAIESGEQISNIRWRFNHYGPYVDDVINAAKSDKAFRVVSTVTTYGDQKELVKLRKAKEWKSLSDQDKAWIDHVIEQTDRLFWKDFIRLVYSTFPVIVSERHSTLDLPKLAVRYKKEMRTTH